MRTIVDLTGEQLAKLKFYCDREGISRAEAVRQAVELLLCQEQRKDEEFREALAGVFGMWKDRNIDAVDYQRQLRAEWDRDPAAR